MKYKIKIYNTLIYGVILFITLNIFFIFYNSLNLKLQKKFEANLYDSVSLKIDVEPEFDSQGIFWWLKDGSNNLILTNYSNESRQIKLFIKIENNPCQSITKIDFNSEEYGFEKNELQIIKNIKISPYESINFYLQGVSKDSCNVKNDSRIFGPKIREWYAK